MFQTLITDRKFLATFYTLPESACLLAELAVERLDVDWSDRAAIERLLTLNSIGVVDSHWGFSYFSSSVSRASSPSA